MSIRSLLLVEVERHIRLEILLRCLVIDDLFLVGKCVILSPLPMRHELFKDQLIGPLFGLVVTQGRLTATLFQAIDQLRILEEAGTERGGQVLTDLRLCIFHSVDLFEETFLRHICLVILI